MSETQHGMWKQSSVLIAGGGIAGASAARFFHGRADSITIVDDRPEPARLTLEKELGIRVVPVSQLRPDWTTTVDLLVVSPGFRPTSPVVTAANAAGISVWGEMELAWHVDQAEVFGPKRKWLVITGTNGKTTTTSMVESIVEKSVYSVKACGNIGLPVLTVLAETPRVEVLAVEASSFQLHYAPSIVADAGVILNIAEDHLDWHGSFSAYVESKSVVLQAINPIRMLDNAVTSELEIAGNAVPVSAFSVPKQGIGISGGMVVDATETFPVEIIRVADIVPATPAGIEDALAAIALTRMIGIAPEEIAAGLTNFRVGAHRMEKVATLYDIDFINDSKATNPHAAQSALSAFSTVVWILGGQLKGAAIDELVHNVAEKLAGVVIIGVDGPQIVEVFRRHAPQLPIIVVVTSEDKKWPEENIQVISLRSDTVAEEIMATAVHNAWELAKEWKITDRRIEAILLAPAAASLDIFSSYAARGAAFTAAAQQLKR